jgi:hypothetical protein
MGMGNLVRRSAILSIAIFVTTSAVTAKDSAYRPPRLENGSVNLQGVWANNNLTPLERPAEFKTLVISTEQADRFQAKFEARLFNPAVPSDPTGYEDPRTIEPIGGELHSSLIIDPEDGTIPKNELFKAKVAAMFKRFPLAADGPEQRINSERCLSAPNVVAPMISFPTDNLHQIVQTASVIVIASELNHEARIIRLNSKHTPATITSWQGDSIGWWDGTTLVVETKYFVAASEARFAPNIMFYVSPQATVTERFTMLSASEVKYVFTVDDPVHYTRPWTGEGHFVRSTDQMLEYACHEGNYSLEHILQGARVQDERLKQQQ